MKQSHYLIKQILPYIEPNIITIHEPCNITHIKKLISTLIGEIYVYYYNKEDNSRQDLTDTWGNTKFNIYDYQFEKLRLYKHSYIAKNNLPLYFKSYSIDFPIMPKKFFNHGAILFYQGATVGTNSYNGTHDIEPCWYPGVYISNISDNKRKSFYGQEYEKYIANKYKENNYNITLNGIEKSHKDGGIDIIAENDNTVLLVQCKNWSLSNEYKINQKDLRAFIGDCYIYIRENNLSNKSLGFHFIVSHDNILTKSAKIFLMQNTFIKFKCIPFEKEG